ncbi:PREDICTED: VQ motif-containing protein 11-like [Nelumbo nucifera]|uniref:VQ motif-containing protein 11-like n=1 Tax=Nelumbo nucifera TaxID=4432 RepID=A0A1U8AR81_NELNU|nr:PREDICTED: VQ motif-containing protein 11-like [Nelumbo nucifera]
MVLCLFLSERLDNAALKILWFPFTDPSPQISLSPTPTHRERFFSCLLFISLTHMDKHIYNIGSSPAMEATPTTFVQADAHTFRELVQKLTGAGEDDSEKLPITLPARFSARSSNSSEVVGPRRSAFKLQERRQNIRKMEIKLGLTSLRNSPTFSPPISSPVTPLSSDPLFSAYFPGSGSQSPSSPAVSEEEKVIAEKGFYLHPSPLNTPRDSEPPELLPLFPLSSHKHQPGDP